MGHRSSNRLKSAKFAVVLPTIVFRYFESQQSRESRDSLLNLSHAFSSKRAICNMLAKGEGGGETSMLTFCNPSFPWKGGGNLLGNFLKLVILKAG